jgi:hypothetical protein
VEDVMSNHDDSKVKDPKSLASEDTNAATTATAKIIPLRPTAKTKLDTSTVKLLRIADEIDAVILRHIEAGDVDPKELAGLLSHRLGTLMKHIEDKETLVDVCVDVLRKQAAVDE